MPVPANATPLLREAIAKVLPSVPEAECLAEAVSPRQAERIRLHVARKLFDRPFRGARELRAFLDRGEYAEGAAKKCRLSEAMIPLDGIGADSFFLNEFFTEGSRLSDFSTLLEWDVREHETQEGFRVEAGDRPDGPKPYEGRLLWAWSRWLDGGRMVYGNLSAALPYLETELIEHADDLARKRFPTKYEKGPEHGKKSGELRRWDMVETPRDMGAMRSAASTIAHGLIGNWARDRLKGRIEASGVWIARTREEDDAEVNERVVFSGPEAMGRARFRTWLADLSAMPDGTAGFEAIMAAAKDGIGEAMQPVFEAVAVAWKSVESHQDLNGQAIASAVEGGPLVSGAMEILLASKV